VKYFKELGLWFLPSGDTEEFSTNPQLTMGLLQKQCEIPREMLTYVSRGRGGEKRNIRQHCCQVGTYFSNKKRRERAGGEKG